jgi:glycosyltransferase involved in cell wall biosynthesis
MTPRVSPPASNPAARSDVAPLITFGVPTYKRPDLLAEALASVTRQLGDATYEIVVCDNGGLPETRRVVEACGAKAISLHVNDPAVEPVANWNRCLERARGDWVTILHDDDALYPWYLELVLPRLREGLSAICPKTVDGSAPPALVRPPTPRSVLRYPPRSFLKSSMTPFPGVLFRRSLGLQLGGFDERMGPLADYDFWYRLAVAGRVEVVPAVGAFYRLNPGQWTDRAWPEMLRRMHLLRLRIAREQWPRSSPTGRWLARFFTYRSARAYEKRYPARPAILARALRFRRICLSCLPSGWVWAWLKRQSGP